MSIPIQIGPYDGEVSRHMRFRRYLREIKIPAFERLRDVVNEEIASGIELCCEFSPNPDPDSLFNFCGFIFGDMYSDTHGSIEGTLGRIYGQLETIETRVLELTGKSPDELDAIEADFWEENCR